MKEWATKEIELACKRENPNWDGVSFDYGCACYQSALKAYNSLCEDNHSNTSYNFTKNILIRLLNELPLSPITEKDFEDGNLCNIKENGKNILLKQCTRRYSLWKEEDEDGNIIYRDTDRQCCVDINNENCVYSSKTATDIINEMFPITMPYLPETKKYKVYTEDFLVDKENGDYDTKGYLYCITPSGEKVEINRFYAEKEKRFVEITKEEYEERKKNKR